MKRWTMLILMSLAATMSALAAPEIAFITEPAVHGEVIIITGENFDPQKTRIKAAYLGPSDFDPRRLETTADFLDGMDERPHVRGTPPDGAYDCEVLGGGERYLHVVMNAAKHSWACVPITAAIWAGDDTGWSQPYVVNRPQAQWLSPRTQFPGEAIRIFGRTFAWGHNLPPAQAFLRKLGGGKPIALRYAPNHREDGHTQRWCLSAFLPDDLEPGGYEVFVHGQHGGAYGWSDPLKLTVAPAKRRNGPVVNVRDLGAKGDGLSDDTEALEKALAQAKGGAVLLPPGAYAISRTIEIPEDVVIRGTGMHQSIICNLETVRFPKKPLVHGERDFELHDLTLRHMPAQGPALLVGTDPQWSEDVTLYRVRIESQQDYGLAESHEYTDKPLGIFKCRRFRMIRCETYGPAGVGCHRKLEDSQFSQNVFQTDRRWRGSAFKFWGAERCIFEDNRMVGDTRGFIMQTAFGVNYRNFIAGNIVERAVLGGNAGETYLVEGAGYLYESPVVSAQETKLATKGWPSVKDKPAEEKDCVERFVVIARGRGLGQWRRIVAADPAKRELTLDAPWRIPPDASSTVVVMNGLIETTFVNNQEVDSGKGLYLYYAGAINNIIDRHLCDRTLGVTIMTRDDRQEENPAEHDTSPDFFNLIRDCRVHDGAGILVGAGGRLPEKDDPHMPLANFGNRVIGNEVQHVVPWSGAQYGPTWRLGRGFSNLVAGISVIPMDLGKEPGAGLTGPPRMIGNVLQDNWIAESRFGFGVSKRAQGTLLYKNYLQWVENDLVDNGIGTVEIDTTKRDAREYTPERGPIR
ncbi:MAG: glycosyl hydrolase family 28-related protein [Planctomycetota bacterium]